ncbi:PorP/SprF family type IX secretion system membrane protein [Solitalea lacus]|uniref:PorP/SprF family type IX secretion system membrane protein n=1 Tax=Solitalea lacus TaxID=2911172 RepID=UPI001EDA8B7E|nr:PorP/SprF family type IX secretion system membrane protein [Solitalea lacus]UKJ09080.1 PorP/SprF family type IX secretion system membrane protein [Solitalea lacus]
MNKKLQLLVFMCFLFTTKVWAQQDAQFSQYMFNGLYINPAYAGFKQNLNINSFYRMQWSGFDGGPRTMTLSLDAPMYDNTMGLGFQVASDKIGNTNDLSAFGIYSYRLQVNDESHLAFGLGVGFYRSAFNGSKNILDDSGDPLNSGNASSSFSPELKFGLFYNTERFYMGLSANNLLSPYLKKDYDLSTISPPKSTQVYLTSGVALPLSENVVMKPSFLLKQDIKGYSTLDLNAFFLFYDKIWVGGAYRNSFKLINKQPNQPLYNANAAILMTELFLGEKFRVGYAFDMSLSAVKDLNASSHEVSLSYCLDVKDIIPERAPAPRNVQGVTERAEKAKAKAAEKETKQKARAEQEASKAAQKEQERKEKEQKTAEEKVVKQKEEPKVIEQQVKEKEKVEVPQPKVNEEAKAQESKAHDEAKRIKEEERQVAELRASEAKRERAEAKARAKAEAKEREDAKRKEEDAKREEERKEKEAARENERAAMKEKDAEKAKEKAEKMKEEKAKEVETPEQREERKKAEKEEAKRIKKLKRQKGAMVTPRYF